jgi:hypothetical protein
MLRGEYELASRLTTWRPESSCTISGVELA